MVIAGLWLLTSGLYLHLWIPAKHILRHTAILCLHILMVAFVILHLPVWLVLLIAERRKQRAWESSQTPAQLEAFKQEHGTHYRTFLRTVTKFSADYLLDAVISMWGRAIKYLASVGYIGLSPLYSHSFEEDQNATKAPLQVFAAAIGRLNLRLGRLRATRLFQFVVLPPAPRVETNQAARRLLRWYRLDALLWGSYVSVNPPKVWLNVERPIRESKDDQRLTERFHPLHVRLGNDSSLVLDQNDPLDTYIALLLALLEALEARRAPRFRLYPRYSDALVLASGERHVIMSQLIRDSLFVLEAESFLPATRGALHPTAKQVLVARASDWAAELLSGLWSDKGPSVRLLKEILWRCAALEPTRAEHHYRLGAAYCLLGNEPEALKSFTAGQESDDEIRYADPDWPELGGVLYVALLDLRLSATWTAVDRVSACAAAYVARLLAINREDVKKEILKKFAEPEISQAHRRRDAVGRIRVPEKILYDLVGLQ